MKYKKVPTRESSSLELIQGVYAANQSKSVVFLKSNYLREPREKRSYIYVGSLDQWHSVGRASGDVTFGIPIEAICARYK